MLFLYFKSFSFDIKYILFALFIIGVNIYLSVLIPSVKASSTSVIQGIRSNKEIVGLWNTCNT